MHEIYLSKERRNARAKELESLGHIVRLRKLPQGSRLHPEYIKDATLEGVTYQTGFGNTDYLRTWKNLYEVEVQ